MVIVKSVFGEVLSGAVGEAGIYSSIGGINYRKRYIKPTNPSSPGQVKVRTDFKDGVTKWKSYNTYQKKAFKYISSGSSLSGYAFFMKRWMSKYLTTRTEPPKDGMFLVGNAMTTGKVWTNPTSSQEIQIPIEAGRVLGIKLGQEPTHELINGGGDAGAVALIDIQMGRIREYGDPALEKRWISYYSNGREIKGEEVIYVPSGVSGLRLAYTRYFPIDYGSVFYYDAINKPTEYGDPSNTVRALEVDLFDPWVRSTKGAIPINSHWDYSSVNPIPHATVETYKLDTYFVTWRTITGNFGEITLAQTQQDEPYELWIEYEGYNLYSKLNLSASEITDETEYILTAST